MRKIIYYITDQGRGHATRSIAIIRELQKSNIEVIVRNSNVKDFLMKSLPNTSIISGITDVGVAIRNDGILINENKTKRDVNTWIHELDTFADRECKIISKIKPNLIISDISVMPFLAAKKTHTPSMAISNFSWYDVLKFISKNELQTLKNAYDCADMTIQLPLGTSMQHFKRKKRTGIVCRAPTQTKKKIRKEIGLKETELSVFFELGKSENELSSDVEGNIKMISTGTRLKNTTHTIKLPEWIEGQNLVLGADLVVCKCGYGIISECLTNGIPFLYLSDDHHLEQKAISDELRKKGLNNRITLKELNNLTLSKDFILSKTIATKEKIDTRTAVNHIREILYN